MPSFESAPFPSSLYADTAIEPAPRAPLDHDRSASIAIIGGGFAGLSTALHLAEAGVDVVVLEAQKPISAGISPSAADSRSADGRPPASSGSLGASNSAYAAVPGRKRTPTRTVPITSSSTISASLSPPLSLAAGVRSSPSNAAVPTVGCPANGNSAIGVNIRTPCGVCAVLRFQDEHRLRQIELAGDHLHARAVQRVGIQHHGQRIAAEIFCR